ncbi:hypothetical protein GALMADRAFT_248922 [Galerina marginata CBS 339.88]|uniref:SMP-30/Gluconolactonase/LRE-like region domain-containing protein n=1 Tax=Galerina marginata (strain CBS 339.88) TaxID=685588 RepID=A0A067SW00_GALM3|nr:hypothetical protein GALMADRAFT_248922 [Galerina marginata CBS 339.88]
MKLQSNSVINFIAILIAFFGGSWVFVVKPRLVILGYGRQLQPINNRSCNKIPQLSACEKIVLHQPTGVLYLACSTISSRVHWTPALGRLNSTGASRKDYVATYDPTTSAITRLELRGFESTRGLSLHGMDVVSSSSNPSELFVYLVNHRAPPGNLLATDVGADSVIEIFKTTLGGKAMTHIKTVRNPVINTPNDVVGSADGKSFYFTNDHGEKLGMLRVLDFFGRSTSSVGYCHVEVGCKYAIQNMHGNNGIARGPNSTIYVANCLKGGLNILDIQRDNTLVITDFVPADRGMDNLSTDAEGFVWAAAFPDTLKLVLKHFSDPSINVPSTALRFSVNSGSIATPHKARYKAETMFEDDGNAASGITSVVYDSQRNFLFLSGHASSHLTICKL